MKTKSQFLLSFALIVLLAGCKQAERSSIEHIKKVTSEIDDSRLINADNSPGDWLSYGRNYAEDRYSTLEQINKDNIKSLGLAWSLGIGTTLNGIETTPVVVDGIVYFTGPWSNQVLKKQKKSLTTLNSTPLKATLLPKSPQGSSLKCKAILAMWRA